MNKQLILIRHGEPMIVKGKKIGLSNAGCKQIQKSSDNLKKEIHETKDIQVISSDSLRCIQTSKIIADTLSVTFTKQNLRLKSADLLKLNESQSKYLQYLASYKKFNVESPDEYFKRICKIIFESKASTTIMVGHEVGIRIILSKLNKTVSSEPYPYGQITKLVLSDTVTDVTIGADYA